MKVIPETQYVQKIEYLYFYLSDFESVKCFIAHFSYLFVRRNCKKQKKDKNVEILKKLNYVSQQY